MSSGSATVPEHLNVQNKFSTAVVLCSELYFLYPEVFVLTLLLLSEFELRCSVPQAV